MTARIRNAMTIDVEDYFQVSAFENIIRPSDWTTLQPRVERNTHRLLDLFSEHNAKATFFILGWVAERFPGVIQRIVSEGHEIASHGMMHQRASAQTPEEFKADINHSKKLLEDIGSCEVIGYRAPSFSFTRANEWVYPALIEAGYKYSSSVYPVVHDHYGIPDAPRFRYKPLGAIDEIPLSTLTIMGKNIPISGGGYFRLYPYWATRWAVKKFSDTTTSPYIFYLHPWEIDPAQPRMDNINFKTRFRHYLNLKKVERRMAALLTDFEWSSMAELYGYRNH